MSYNIDTVHVKKCELTIPMAIGVEAMLMSKFSINLEHTGADTFEASGCSEGFHIEGLVDRSANVYRITYFIDYGEGSGGCWHSVVEFLETTMGELQAVVVWEGGDSITKLSVKDGVVTEEEVVQTDIFDI